MLTAIPPRIRSESPVQKIFDVNNVQWDEARTENNLEEFKKNIHDPHYAGPKGLSKFMHDEWSIRKASILANDVAESFKESLYHWFPRPIAHLIYGGLWLASIASTGIRVLINYHHHPKPEEKLRAGAKLLVHEGISAIAAPVVVANVANSIQNKIYNMISLPKSIQHLIRPIVSLMTCYHGIDYLDPPAQRFSSWLTGIVDDHHKQVNDYIKEREPKANPVLV